MRVIAAFGIAAFAVVTSLAQPVPPSFDRALDCRNPQDAPLCREIQRNQTTSGGAPPNAYRAPTVRPTQPPTDWALDCRNPQDSPLCAALAPKRRPAAAPKGQPVPQQPAAPSPARLVPQGDTVTDCDTYAASDSDPQRKATGVPYEKIDPALAIPACESAVRQYPNNPRLSYQLGRAYLKANNIGAALEQNLRAAEQNYAPAQNNLGVMYANGQGIAKDDAQAVTWYRKAAEQGLPSAQTFLGIMYLNGQGIGQDFAQAVAWFRKAAERGDAAGQFNLGAMYVTGRGAAVNENQAGIWFRKAADQGFAAAQFSLGVMYENGNGVARDVKTAVNWYRKAADQGDEDAKKKLAERDRAQATEQNAKVQFDPTNVQKRPIQSPSPYVEFDPLLARKKAIFGTALVQTQVCVHDALRARLLNGERDRGRLIQFAKSMCSGAMVLVMRQAGVGEQTGEVMDVLAEHELDSLLSE